MTADDQNWALRAGVKIDAGGSKFSSGRLTLTS
jgi:hypothetical protein